MCLADLAGQSLVAVVPLRPGLTVHFDWCEALGTSMVHEQELQAGTVGPSMNKILDLEAGQEWLHGRRCGMEETSEDVMIKVFAGSDSLA